MTRQFWEPTSCSLAQKTPLLGVIDSIEQVSAPEIDVPRTRHA
jgi:hypothetical protein